MVGWKIPDLYGTVRGTAPGFIYGIAIFLATFFSQRLGNRLLFVSFELGMQGWDAVGWFMKVYLHLRAYFVLCYREWSPAFAHMPADVRNGHSHLATRNDFGHAVFNSLCFRVKIGRRSLLGPRPAFAHIKLLPVAFDRKKCQNPTAKSRNIQNRQNH